MKWLAKTGHKIGKNKLSCVWVERLWRTVKQEEVYIRDHVDGLDVTRTKASGSILAFTMRRGCTQRMVTSHQG